jgi:hypothetical protein
MKTRFINLLSLLALVMSAHVVAQEEPTKEEEQQEQQKEDEESQENRLDLLEANVNNVRSLDEIKETAARIREVLEKARIPMSLIHKITREIREEGGVSEKTEPRAPERRP